MRIQVIEGKLAVCRLRTIERLDLKEDFSFLSKTDEERSLVGREEQAPHDRLPAKKGWRPSG